MRLIISVVWLGLFIPTLVKSACVNLWDADINDPSITICPVITSIGENCIFPFTYSGTVYRSCILGGPNNPNKIPQCMTASNNWGFCNVPTDAYVNYVTTRKAGSASINGASINGGTLLWISGARFAPNLFSLNPTAATSNEVFLTNSFSSYVCEIHPDKTTSTQITCYTPAMPAGQYFVRIKVNGAFIPRYQYISESNAVVKVADANTPKISSLIPSVGLPGSFVTFNGDFKTICYTRDQDGCADDYIATILRVYMGPQSCDLIDPISNVLYGNLTQNQMTCLIKAVQVGYFNASVLVSNEYGRSLQASNTFFVSPNEILHTYQSFAAISSVTPQSGSLNGGTFLTITGQYFYNDANVPAQINIGGVPCDVTSFDMSNLPNTVLTCVTRAAPAAGTQNENFGNRGVTLIRNQVLTTFANLATAQPAANSDSIVLNQASYQDSGSSDVTVWMRGFFYPQKTSNYEFSIETNGAAVFLISNSSDAANKINVSSKSSTSVNGKVLLQANTYYYYDLIASKASGGLTVKLNGKMLDTSLTDQVSAFVLNEVQNIQISSNVTLESFSVLYGTVNRSAGVSEVQFLNLTASNNPNAYFVLSFDGALTIPLQLGSTADLIASALNDLPTMYPNKVLVVAESTGFNVTFPADFGDVPCIQETSGAVLFACNESVTGVASGNKIQLLIENYPSAPFDLRDTAANIKTAVQNSFFVRCPSSVQTLTSDVFKMYDFETECSWSNVRLGDTAFCGKCARKNTANLFWNVNSTLSTYPYLCFAYKFNRLFSTVYVQLSDMSTVAINVNPIADNQWHYMCINVKQAVSDAKMSSSLLFFQAWISGAIADFYIDIVSIRKQPPMGYDTGATSLVSSNVAFNLDDSLAAARRLLPPVQLFNFALTVTSATGSLTFSYRPNNCSCNLQTVVVRQTMSNAIRTSQLSFASPPVSGTFSLAWNGLLIDGIPADSTENDMVNYLGSVKDFGNVQVTRTGDCSGYKWQIKWINGGDKPELSLNTSSLIGNSPSLKCTTTTNGGALFTPVRDDLLRTLHPKPQVTVSINGVASLCNGSCDFEWLSAKTPTVSAIDASVLSAIRITGTGFETTPALNMVALGAQYLCNVTSATSTQLICNSGEVPVGTYNVSLIVVTSGLATMSASTLVTFTLTATAISPSTGGVGGGLILNITGTGFSPKSTVTVDSNNCPIVSQSYSLIRCNVPSNPTTTDKQVSVVVTDGSNTATVLTQFTYSYSSTPQITSISPSALSVMGGEVVTCVGSSLPATPDFVKIGDKLVQPMSTNSTHIIFKSPALAPGVYKLNVGVGALGNALVSQDINYKFYISSISPQIGSIKGGTFVNIRGEGFNGACDKNQVKFGLSNCQIVNCTNDWIGCVTGTTFVTYQVDNTGSDPYYGKGYAWNKPYLTINVGDKVRWSWSPPTGISGVSFKVEQVLDAASYIPSGFTSGDPTATGSFEYEFNTAGTFYYWSNRVESTGQIIFRGVVVVQASSDKELEVDVTQNGFSAQKCSFPFTYNSASYTSCTSTDLGYDWCAPSPAYSGQPLKCSQSGPVPSYTCPGTGLTAAGCSTTLPSSIYKMLFTLCNNQLPSITSVSRENATAEDEITINGAYFSATQCENEVTVGSVSCSIQSSSATEIVCKIGANSQLQPGSDYLLQVRVKNIGYALPAGVFKIKFLAMISSVTPAKGSTAGGTLVTIQGDGFITGFTYVLLDNVQYLNFASISYSQITLVTKPGDNGVRNVSVVVGQTSATGSATFEYSLADSPTLTSVTPTSISDSSLLTIVGTNFDSDQSKVSIKVGAQDCSVQSATSTQLTCQIAGLSIGTNALNVNINGVGNAINSNSVSVSGTANIKSVSPTSGSINGGTVLTISGNGFDKSTTVKLDGANCSIVSYSVNSLTCRTVAHAAQAVTFAINSGSTNFDASSLSFTYDASVSPTVSSLTPNSGVSGLISITGTNFGTDPTKVSVKIGSSTCTVSTVTATSIQCTLSDGSAGVFPVVVTLANVGDSNSDIKYTYQLAVSQLSRTQGSIGGGLSLQITGTGFSSNTNVTICNKPCPLQSAASTSTSITCTVPASDNSAADSSCTVSVSENSLSQTSTFQYSLSLTPKLTSVTPKRGGTAGGTLLTIIGTGFPNDASTVQVSIAGSTCDIQSISSTQITCRTNSYAGSSIKTPLKVSIVGSGVALNDGSVEFEYIDLWSSKFTWGGTSPPVAGDLVVISASQTIYLDTVTPVLKGIIIQGGALIFDDNQDVSLNAEYIIISDAGRLQVGTADAPFQHRAVITMYGSVRSIELPIFGSKVTALRNGTIDLHGMPVGVTWTQLGQTALAGSTTIQLKEPVIWPIGSEIVIVTTGDKLSVGQNELRKIVSKSADNTQLTLDSALGFSHLSEKRTFGSRDIYIRAEVGLLSRNVVYQGSKDSTWARLKTAPACPTGFNPSEFATQTCFLGRYGPEQGTDEFGAHILISGMRGTATESVILRISNVEFFHVGQAFRLGRYPIHFHMNGDMRSSYVRECAIHESFNRAVNVHATNYVTITRNVIYNILGGAYFLEDGVEIGNVFSYNLAIFVRTSSSLLNEDVTPAAFWVTNPNNTYLHNSVAGGSHFGYWYRLLDNSEGPSFSPNFCPKKIPMGTFFNNSVHSVGRFGLWIFPGYTPTVSGSCSDSRLSPAKFEQLTSYSCDKGAEYVMSNPMQFLNFTAWDHDSAGIEAKQIILNQDPNTQYYPSFYNETTGSVISNSLIIGDSVGNGVTTATGLVIAWDRGLLVKNIAFYNFANEGSRALMPTDIAGRCVCSTQCSDSINSNSLTCASYSMLQEHYIVSEIMLHGGLSEGLRFGCGGWTTFSTGLSFTNVKYRTTHRWDWDFVLRDLDGSVSGTPNAVVVSLNNITKADPACTVDTKYQNGIVCKDTISWIRFAFNGASPDFPVMMNFTDKRGQTVTNPLLKKRLTHKMGYMIALQANQEYLGIFDQAERPTNMSYSGTFYGLKQNEYVIIKHNMFKKPDRVILFGTTESTESLSPLSGNYSNNAHWYWENSTYTMSYIIKNNNVKTSDFVVSFSAVKCRFVGCKPPESPSLKLPVTARPPTALNWSMANTWTFAEPGWGGFFGNNQFGLPKDGDSVKIPDGKYVVIDCPLPKLKYLYVEGVLELDNGRDHRLEADVIFINGGQLIVGWENNPITTDVKIVINGVKSANNFMLPNGINNIGAKGIGVFGGLDLHGKPRNVSWTRLAKTAALGTNQIVLVDAVDWQVGEQIIVTTTSYISSQSEVRSISAISADRKTLSLNATFVFDHLAFDETFPNGDSYQVAAGVGLLTRNLKVIGGEYPNQDSDLYGFRIIVTDYSAMVNEISTYYKGYARISDVEMVRPGQYSRDTGDDSKFAILFSDLGDNNASRPSYVRNSAFHPCYYVGVGIFNSNGIPIENNVFYRTLDFGLFIEGKANIIRKNLVINNLWSPSVLNYLAQLDKNFWGAIDVHAAETVILEDNFVAGAERVGIYSRGDLCADDKFASNHSIRRNTIYAALTGAVVMPEYGYQGLNCTSFIGYTVYKATHWGIYYQGDARNVVVEQNTLIENQVGVFVFIIAPPSLSHVSGNKRSIIQNNLIVGQTKFFDCNKDVKPNDLNFAQSQVASSFGAGPNENGKVGVVWSNFLDGKNGAPKKPWAGVMTYNQVSGLQIVRNTTFANFGATCNGLDIVIATNKKNDDGQHPVQFQSITLYNVANTSKVFIHRPNIGKINPSDCVDMDCDALKKALLTDLDGSFLGTPGAVFSQSEFEWGSQQRGLGDFRIPKELLAAPNGTMIPPSQVYSGLGIVRDPNFCSYRSEWQAYECRNMDYKMLIIESMDNDTESRRLSPVAIFSDNKYLDLINGPQDHGWCSGYTCQKRVSTFLAIITANRNYDVYLTSTPPNQLRFRIINADSSFRVRMSMYYSNPQRIDVYKDDVFVPPTNADYSTGDFTTKDVSANLASYMPSFQNASGTNLFVKTDRKAYFALDGASVIDLKIAPVLFVRFGFPAITPNDFFKPATLVGNVALMLGVDPSSIKRVNVVRESRRKRSTGLVFLEVTIGTNQSNSSNSSSTAQQEMLKLDALITQKFSTGQLQQAAQSLFNVTIASLSVQRPSADAGVSSVAKIGRVVVLRDAADCYEQGPCRVQPVIKIVDDSGATVVNLGSDAFPWTVVATLNSSTNASAHLIQATCVVKNGFANFTMLGITLAVQSFSISYNLLAPDAANSSAAIMNANSGMLQSFPAQLTCKMNEDSVTANENQAFNLTISIVDKFSKYAIPDIKWRGNQWMAEIRLYSLSKYQPAGSFITANSTAIFDPSQGVAAFNNLVITRKGMYVLMLSVYSTNYEFNFTCLSSSILIKSALQSYPSCTSQTTPNVILKFNGNFSAIEPERVKSTIYNLMLNENVTLGCISAYAGSVMVAGTSDTLIPNNTALYNEIGEAGMTFAEANYNGVKIAGVLITGDTGTGGGSGSGTKMIHASVASIASALMALLLFNSL